MYTVDPNADIPIMLLQDHIGDYGDEDGQGIDGAMFAQELMQLDLMGKASIKVLINCPGGVVMDGMNIYNAILHTKTPVDTVNTGIAASMGGVIFMAGRKRIMNDYALLMMHNPAGTSDDKELSAMAGSLVTMISAKSGCTPDECAEMMNQETWLTASECLEKGFCTEIQATSEANRKRMPAQGIMAMWKEASAITNNIFTKNTIMSKVTAKLNIQDGSTEDTIVSAIGKITNDLQAKQDECHNLATELAAAKANSQAIQDKLTASENQLAEEKRLKEEAATVKATEDEATAEVAATEAVTNFVKIGKIKNDKATIESWKALLKKDLPGTKKLLEDLPMNKVSNKVTDSGGSNADAVKSLGTVAGKMIEIENRLKKEGKL